MIDAATSLHKRGGLTKRQAIDRMCRDCIYDPVSGLGTWRQQTAACTAWACPLWHWRPVSTSKKPVDAANDATTRD